MTYAVSKLNGNYEAFKELLKEIKFKETDTMYVLGNIVGEGNGNIELVLDLAGRYNIYCIMGENDYTAANLLNEFVKILKEKSTPSSEYAEKMKKWVSNGGNAILEEFKDADNDTKDGFLDFLSDLPTYEDAEVKSKDFLLISRGIRGFSPKKHLDRYAESDFFDEDLNLNNTYFKGVTIVSGYSSTEPKNIVKANGNIQLGGGQVSCLCLENGKEFYA